MRANEGATSLILASNLFLILMAYYLIKPVREGWLSVSLFQGFTQLEVKAYSAFGQSLLLLAVLPLYAAFAAIWTRRQLIVRSGIGFSSLLVLFWILRPEFVWSQVPFAGIAFYMFVGIFSVTLVAQFWSFAADVYGEKRGKRLFPIVAVGASAGAAVGAWTGQRLIESEMLGAFDLILLAIVPLAIAIRLAIWTDKRGTYGEPTEWTRARWHEPAAPSDAGAYRVIAEHRYLGATALMVMIFSWIVASGDNVLFGLVQQSIQENLNTSLNTDEIARQVNAATTAFYGDLYFWINTIGLLLQSFFVSRLLRYGGFMALMLTTPLISFTAYLSMAIAPVIGLIKAMKIAENSSNYSVNNTARHMLWLPVSKDMLYQAKTVIDTLFVRIGDGLAAVTVLIGTRVVTLEVVSFLWINVVLAFIWIPLAVFLVKENRRWRINAPLPPSKPA